MRTLHPRAFTVSVFWTLGLLYLGSIVHATESSLACPDWPTCFGTMVPEMTGGVFWEHLHRLVAGGLLLLWSLATWRAWKETRRGSGIFAAALAGLVLLLVQSAFGGLTVIFKLPDLVSTTHLSLALLFLALATALASATAWIRRSGPPNPVVGRRLEVWAIAGAVLVFGQSVVGGLVRHTDAGMACPDAPLCLGEWVPPMVNGLVALHFTHRVLGVLAAVVVVSTAIWASRAVGSPGVRGVALAAGALAVFQVGLGFLSVLTGLAVVPVSLHTLVAATLLVTQVHLAATGRAWAARPTVEPVAADVA